MGNKSHASMQKKAYGFMKDAMNKMRDWWVSWIKLWLKRLLEYTIVFSVVVLVGHFVSSMANIVYFRYPFDDFGYPFNFSYPLNEIFRHSFNVTANLTINGTDNAEIYAAEMYADNARSILCTLVGSEAAIVAIVISLTLIAIELTASEYSPRVIDISLRNPDMWILLLIYGISIFYALVLTKQVPHDSWIPFEDVSLAFWLGVFSYAALVPYIRNISHLLKPETIIERLASKITSKKILTTEKTEKDPIQPIMDIIRVSIMKYDFETMRVGLRKLTDRVIEVIDSKIEVIDSKIEVIDSNSEKISMFFCNRLEGIGKFAISRADEESSRRVIINLEYFGKKGIELKKIDALKQAVLYIIAIGKTAVGKKELKDTTQRAASALATLTILSKLSKKIVKAVIHDYESSLEEDHDAFQKFKDVYEQELKKRGEN